MSRPFSFHNTTVYHFMTSQLKMRFQEVNNVFKSKSTDGRAELEKSIICIPRRKVQRNEIQDIRPSYQMFCMSACYIVLVGEK
jgi:hypothetical protein